MSEKVVAEALSGGEVRKAVAQLVDDELRKAGVRDVDAFQTFYGTVKIELWCKDTGRTVEVDKTAVVNGKVAPTPEDTEDEFLERFDAEFEIAEKPPNQIRVETEQEVPVADSKGVVRRVKYQRKGAK